MPVGFQTAAPTMAPTPSQSLRSRYRRGLPLAALWLACAAFWPPAASAWDAARMAQAAQDRGPGAVAAIAALQTLLRTSALQEDVQRLQGINDFYNHRIAFATDLEVWGVDDYWASPLQTLARGRGDCEDYAIAKYATLLAAGVEPQRLQLVYVLARQPRSSAAQAHMVLTWRSAADAEPLVLDNLRPEVMPAALRPDLTPLFSFNAEGLWQANQPAGDPMVRLSRWRDVWRRTREEGFP